MDVQGVGRAWLVERDLSRKLADRLDFIASDALVDLLAEQLTASEDQDVRARAEVIAQAIRARLLTEDIGW